MKSVHRWLSVSVLGGLVFWGLGANAWAQERLKLDRLAVCTGVQDREPVGTATEFPAGVSPIFCHTLITGAEEPTTVTVLWYYRGERKAEVVLSVGGKRWRTWSSKVIPVELTGPWRVEVVGPGDQILGETSFAVVPWPDGDRFSGVKVTRLAVGTGIEAQELTGEANSFPEGTSTVFCYSLVEGAEKPTVIRHMWYRLLDHGKEEIARINLEVEEETLGTWSGKNIPQGERGKWRVEVLAANGKLLKAVEFTLE